MVRKEHYAIQNILETYAHADHLTASYFLKQQLDNHPDICIGTRTGAVQATWAEKYGIEKFGYGGAFDKLFEDDETFSTGNLQAKIVHLPGRTPDHVGYLTGPNIVTGDSIFNPIMAQLVAISLVARLLIFSQALRNYFRCQGSSSYTLDTIILMAEMRYHTRLSRCSKRRTSM